ncbi:MAG: PilN domain-containing protein [Gammaproteobacteria bacterium]|nr:PilN domain-containing protein [Gammaproteobacteria bacterium]MDH5729464.1 PilN domain-containing protein [Gammaproteobacteria bacterium]
MPRINLLPWREAEKKKREQRFFVILGATAVAAIIVVVIVHANIQGMINYQNQRNNFLAGELGKVDMQIAAIKKLEEKKQRLLDRMDIIRNLQGSRPEIVHLYEELVNTLPDGAQLVRVEHKNNIITVEGIADSNARVSTFMRNLDASPWLHDPELLVIDSSRKQFPNGNWFSLRFHQGKKPTQKIAEAS